MTTPALPPDLEVLRRLAALLDESIRVPFTRWRLGLDGLLGLVPGLGDAVGALMSLAVVLAAVRHRVPPGKLAAMVGRILLDLGVGAVPVLGDVADFLFKQNLRNLDVVLAHRDASRPPRTLAQLGGGAVVALAGMAAAVLAAAAGVAAGAVWLVVKLVGS